MCLLFCRYRPIRANAACGAGNFARMSEALAVKMNGWSSVQVCDALCNAFSGSAPLVKLSRLMQFTKRGERVCFAAPAVMSNEGRT